MCGFFWPWNQSSNRHVTELRREWPSNSLPAPLGVNHSVLAPLLPPPAPEKPSVPFHCLLFHHHQHLAQPGHLSPKVRPTSRFHPRFPLQLKACFQVSHFLKSKTFLSPVLSWPSSSPWLFLILLPKLPAGGRLVPPHPPRTSLPSIRAQLGSGYFSSVY